MAVKGYTVSLLAVALVIIRTGALDYIGCFSDRFENRLFPYRVLEGAGEEERFSWRIITNEYCQKFCRTLSTNSTYFGTEFGLECYCGNDYTRRGPNVSDSECNKPCNGNPAQMCGGADRISVYYVCKKGSFGSACSDTCHCSDEGFCYRNGSCLTGQCTTGWEGPTCSTDINECSLPGYCNQNCKNTPGSYQCSCYNSSYRMLTDNKTCIDIDECKEKLDNCNQACMNHDGWFSCECNTGFNTTDNGVTCTDINECETNNGGCSHECNNTMGSYHCECPEDLILLDSDRKTCIKKGVEDTLQSWKKAVIGARVGGGIFIIIVVVVVVCLIHRKRKQELKASDSEQDTEQDTEVRRNGNHRSETDVAKIATPQKLSAKVDVGNDGHSTANISDFTSNQIQQYEDDEGTIAKYEKLDISARYYDNQSAIDRQNYTTLNIH